MGADSRTSSVTFPQGTVLDGLSNIAVSRPNSRIQFPRPGEVSPQPTSSRKEDVGHTTTLGFAYVSEAGRRAFQQRPFVFPVGSIIVRERLLSPSSSPDQLVVMIKHERDFNPKANGWEFLMINGEMTKVIKREKKGDCLKCHLSASSNDFVFPEEKRH